jgi:predicted regulator of Ras-like GTPase activity (Roadblock/LC7/MglB family)
LVSGMAAAMLGVGERISSELMASTMEQVYVRSEKGFVILNAVGTDSVLVVLTTKEAKLGLVFIEVKRRCVELAKAIQSAA